MRKHKNMKTKECVKITEEMLNEYGGYLREEERSSATIEKYLRDTKALMVFLGEGELDGKEKLREYKEYLKEHYKISSANSMLAALRKCETGTAYVLHCVMCCL